MAQNGDASTNAPPIVEQHLSDFFDASGSILGDRLAECRRDRDGAAHVTVIDLDDSDVAALQDTAAGLGMSGWVRIERADPAALETWARLRHDLIALVDCSPDLMWAYPVLEPGYLRPPVRVHFKTGEAGLAAAARLHERYGDFLALQVGALPYPADAVPVRRPQRIEPDRQVVDPAEMTVELAGPLSICSGETARPSLILLNRSARSITVNTNGSLTADIVDPATGATVGGFSGMQIQPLIRFTAAPGETVAIRLLVGTESFAPDLGYTVPAGQWQLVAAMDLDDGRHLITPPLDFTITD